jgi:hypothetical protein
VLALVAVVLGVWLWVDRGTITDAERGKRPKNVLPAFRRDEVSRIEITKGAEKLVLARDVDRDADASWRMESPEAGPADPNTVEQLSSAFEFATFVRKVDPGIAHVRRPRATGVVGWGRSRIASRSVPRPRPRGLVLKLEGDAVCVITKELTEQPQAQLRTRAARSCRIAGLASPSAGSDRAHRADRRSHVQDRGRRPWCVARGARQGGPRSPRCAPSRSRPKPERARVHDR